jgi:CRP-like cAMP-binding protein
MRRLDLAAADTVQFTQMVRKFRFFGALRMEVLERVLGGLHLYAFDRGEKVCSEGQPGDSFFVVQRGRLSVTRRAGRILGSRKVAVLEPGDCFGEMALLDQTPRNATVACLEPSRVFVLPARHFQGVMEQNPEFAQEIRGLAELRQFELDHGKD